MEDQKNLISAQELTAATQGIQLAAIATGPGLVGEQLNAAAPTYAPKANNGFNLN